MTKNDLKTGMKVMLRDNTIVTVIQTDEGWNIVKEGFGLVSADYSDNLFSINKTPEFDIMTVYKGWNRDMFFSSRIDEVLWHRPVEEVIPEYTVDELCKMIGHEFKIKK